MIHGIVVSKIDSCDTDVGGHEGEMKIQYIPWDWLPAGADDVVYPSPRNIFAEHAGTWASGHVGRCPQFDHVKDG